MAKSRKQIEEEARMVLQMLEQQANLQSSINSNYDKYIEAVKKYRDIQSTLNKSLELERETRKKILEHNQNINRLTADELHEETVKLKILEKQNLQLSLQRKMYKDALKSVNSMNLALKESAVSMTKFVGKLPGTFKGLYGDLKGFGLFEMDKAMKKSALSMGVLSKESVGFRGSIVSVAKQTSMIGVGIKELSELQARYSESVGTTALMSERGLKALGEMAVATGLGVEGTSQMASDMLTQNVSAEKTAKYVEQTMNDSHKMGLNATTVIGKISKNIKLLNKYNFREGVKGLAKMAQTITKLGVDMEFAAGFADKLWDVEGAVNMSAQLQVMGGAWAQMADPFHLMYMARNDMAGLTEEIGKAAEQSVVFNKRTGEFDMSAKEMHRLKVIAEQTGIAYDDLVTAGKNAKKFSMINTQINFGFGGDKDLKEYVTSKSFLNEKGEAKIVVNGETKLLKTLTQQDKNILKNQMLEQQSLRARAEEARSFDETLENLIMQLKIYLLPMITKLSDPKNGVISKIDSFVKRMNSPGGFGEKIEKIASVVGDFVNGMANFMIEHPVLVASIVGLTKSIPLLLGAATLMSGIWNFAKWFGNGLALSKGFMAGTGGAGGIGGGKQFGGGKQIGGSLFGKAGGKFYKGGQFLPKGGRAPIGGATVGGSFLKSGGAIGSGVLGGGMAGIDEYSEQKEKGKGTGEAIGRGLLKGLGAGGGAWAGAAAGAAIGSVVPVVGNIIGGLIGGALGAWGGGALGDLDNWGGSSGGDGVNDGIFTTPINDGKIDFNKFGGDLDNYRNSGGINDGLFTKPINDGKIDFNKIGGEMISKSINKKFNSNFSRGNAVINNGKITPINNTDELRGIVAKRPGGPFDRYGHEIYNNSRNQSNRDSRVTHKIEDVRVGGTITLDIPQLKGKFDVDINNSLLKNLKENIQRKLTEDVNYMRNKNSNGGKLKPGY